MRILDGIIRKPKIISRLNLDNLPRTDLKNPQGRSLKTFSHWPVAVAIILVAILINSVTLLSAFEAHVVNVTATIERRPSQCDALSPGYWRNHEGCNQGGGESLWTAPINALSATFSGVFTNYTGAGICAAEWQPNCPSVATRAGRLCRAKLHTLADELNLVSGHLDLNALIAGADRGGGSFDRLGLSPSSTVGEALAVAERVIAEHESDATLDGREWLVDVSQVAERLYSFYEDENPIAPQCIFELDQLNSLSVEPLTEVEPQVEVLSVTVAEPVELTATSTVTTVTEATSTPTVIEEVIEEALDNPLDGLSGEQSVEQTVLATTTPEVIEAVVEETVEEIELPAADEEDQPVETVEAEPAPPPQPEAGLPVAEEPAPIEESVEPVVE